MDPHQARLRRGGSELVGNGPPRVAAHRSERGLQRAVVELHHNAVDVVVQLVAALLPLPATGHDGIDGVHHPHVGVHPKPGPAQPLKHVVVAGELHALQVAYAVEPRGERTGGGDARVQLA